MAARKKKGGADEEDVRSKIQAVRLIDRLTDYALGEVELSATQIKAIEVLLKKALPDLPSKDTTGNKDVPVEAISRIELVAVEPDEHRQD